MFKTVLALALCAMLFLTACGGSGDAEDGATIVAGPTTFALPFLPDSIGESQTVGLRNLSTTDALVTATAFTPTGVAYPPGPTTLTIPAQGGVQVPVAVFTSAALQLGGWLFVDTRDVTTLDGSGEPTPTATSGFVAAYMKRAETGKETDSAMGAAFREDLAYVSLNPRTIAYQVVNRSFDPLAGGSVPTAISVDVTVFDAFGVPGVTTPTLLPANGSTLFVPVVATGRVEITPTVGAGQPAPATTVFQMAIAALEADPQVFIEARFLDIARDIPQRFVGFDVEFGFDVDGNEHDFATVITNAAGNDASVVLENVLRANGQSLLAQPRIIGLDAKHTKYLATTTRDSQGLEAGEPSPFDDIFGDVALATGLEVVTLVFSVPADVSISARGLNSFKSFYRVMPGRKLTTDVAACGIFVPATTTTAITNLISLMNPGANAVDVNIRGFTPGGTEYLVEVVSVPAFSRLDWSPDGRIFTEDPTDVTAPPVPFMAFRLSAIGGIFFDGRLTRVDARDLITTMTPHAIRDLRVD